jgi:4-hydroxy-3-methylbut-2-en-1-yl diphosphate reductase
MEIHLAESAGCCFGVKRAIKMALEAAASGDDPLYMLGDIVHNEHVVRQIAEAGVQIVDSLDQIPSGTLVIRAHGAVPEIYDTTRSKGLNIIDATCPLVLEIHEIARKLQADGYTIVVIGDHEHDEVVGIAGQVRTNLIISTPDEAEQVERISRIGVVVQSTQNIEDVRRIVAVLAGKCRELRFVNTICPATTARQRDIRQLPRDHDVVIIIGSYASANTCRLREISNKINPNTYQIESADELLPAWFDGVASVAVSAGASTPDEVIRAVLAELDEIGTRSNS